MRRRSFIKKAALPPTVLAAGRAMKLFGEGGLCVGAEARKTGQGGTIPTRPYGRTDVRLSVVGFGGYMVSGMDPSHVARLVDYAVERGVNYFDVAPTYGNAEVLLGPAIRPHRERIFLACKTTQRDRSGAEKELHNSLDHLKTEHLDLYQLHAINDLTKDVDAVFSKGGAMEVFLEARKAGKVRYLGFSSHTVEAAMSAMDRYAFDSILFPVNFACWFKGGFGPSVVAKAESKGIACLALKALARQKWPEGDPGKKDYPRCWYQPLTDRREAELGLRFALSRRVTAAVSPADEKAFRLMLDLATDLRPLTVEEERTLKTLAAALAPIFQIA